MKWKWLENYKYASETQTVFVLLYFSVPKVDRGQPTQELWKSLLKHGIDPVHFTTDFKKMMQT